MDEILISQNKEKNDSPLDEITKLDTNNDTNNDDNDNDDVNNNINNHNINAVFVIYEKGVFITEGTDGCDIFHNECCRNMEYLITKESKVDIILIIDEEHNNNVTDVKRTQEKYSKFTFGNKINYIIHNKKDGPSWDISVLDVLNSDSEKFANRGFMAITSDRDEIRPLISEIVSFLLVLCDDNHFEKSTADFCRRCIIKGSKTNIILTNNTPEKIEMLKDIDEVRNCCDAVMNACGVISLNEKIAKLEKCEDIKLKMESDNSSSSISKFAPQIILNILEKNEKTLIKLKQMINNAVPNTIKD
jgi:hypothetical protein